MNTLAKNFRTLAIATLTAGIGLTLLPNLHADEWNKKTILKVNEAVELPSCCTPDHTVVLQPGEYVMVLVDSLSDRHIVRVFDKDQKNVITTVLAIPNYRLKPTGKTVFAYWEVPAGQPRALRAWFYPGDNFGHEFVYPKQKASVIAAHGKTSLTAMEAETTATDDLKRAPLVAMDQSGASTKYVASEPEAAAVVATQPTSQPTPTPEALAPVATAEPVHETSLPHTASQMPLLGLAGLISLALFAALGFRSKRSNNI